MSLLKAKLNGETVYAEQGETLRGEDLRCPYCGARLIIRHFPERPEYLFALKDGELHKSADCKLYQKFSRNAPALINTSPEEFFAMMSTPKKPDDEGGGSGGKGGKGLEPRITINPMKAKTLEHLIKSGMLSLFPKYYLMEVFGFLSFLPRHISDLEMPYRRIRKRITKSTPQIVESIIVP